MTTAPGSKQDFAAFRRWVRCRQDESVYDVFEQYQDVIRIKKESVALRKLMVIFEQALEVSNTYGFQAMSVRCLSEKTGMSMGSLYSYIESKDRLLGMMLTYGQVVVSRSLRIPEDLTRPPERLRYVLRTHVYLTEVLQPWFYFSYMESRHFDRDSREQAIAAELRTEQMVADLLREGVHAGDFTVDQPEFTAALIKPLLQDWYLKRWKYRRREMSVDGYADGVIAFVESAIAATSKHSPIR